MKTLYLVRHAKSSWKDTSLADDQRPLNKRGKRNAPEMGQYLAQRNTQVDRVVCSPANRARSTARLIAAGIGFDFKKIVQDERLYFDGLRSMLEIIRETDDSSQSLMMVGHNPDMTNFFNKLCGYQTDNMPTCAVAQISLDGDWRSVEFGDGQMLDYMIPRNL